MKYLLILFLIIFAGCSTEMNCRVESDTFWSGSFGGVHYTGTETDGVRNITLGDANDCVTVQKQTEGGLLRITVTEKTVFFGTEEIGQQQTNIPYGVVSVCK